MTAVFNNQLLSVEVKLLAPNAKRKIVLANRWADEQSDRTQPSPNVPGGPYHKISQIYYFSRDARREVRPPMIISGSKQIAEKESPAEKECVTPGKTYNWSN